MIYHKNRTREGLRLEKEINNYEGSNFNIPISVFEVQKAITLCQNNKAPGVDYIPNEFIEHTNIENLLHRVYCYCFQNSIAPKIWLRSLI